MSTEARPTKAKRKGRLMNQADVEEELGIPRRSVVRWATSGAGGFPQPVQVVERTFLFNRLELEKWAAGRSPTPG